MFDTIIHGGMLIDGTRAPRRRGDVGVCGDRIEAIGDLSDAQAQRKIDASGLIVAPGFIDVHNHSDGWLVKTPHLSVKTQQGFTTELLAVDGISYAPVDQFTAPEWLYYLRSLDALEDDEYQGWETLAEYAEVISDNSAQNIAMHIPYANVRTLACGWRRADVDDFQMQLIQEKIIEGMQEGAVGLSTGLDYIAQCFSTTDELVAASHAMSMQQGIYVTHVRYKKGLLEGFEEAIEIGRRANVPVHLSHVKAGDSRSADEVLTFLDRARREVDLSFDVYPYQRGSTMLNYLLPYEVWEDGPRAAADKLRSPGVRARFEAGLAGYFAELDAIHIAWVNHPELKQHQGQLLSEFVEQSGMSAADALAELLIATDFAVLCVMNAGDDTAIHPILQHDLYMLGSDGIYFADGQVHPRVAGSSGRLLGACVREHKLFSLEDAVHKMSEYPARRFGLAKRGVLAEGYFADIVMFNEDEISDRATYENPHQPTVGIQSVLVNGVEIVGHGKPCENLSAGLPGRYLRFRQEN